MGLSRATWPKPTRLTPFCVRTALAKKWHSPLWYNMYYDGSIKAYEEDLWRHALGGGRMNFHPLWPHPWEKLTTSLLSGKLLAADCRVRLLNYISTAPIDCPVAVVFGHPSALNWAGAGLADAGAGRCQRPVGRRILCRSDPQQRDRRGKPDDRGRRQPPVRPAELRGGGAVPSAIRAARRGRVLPQGRRRRQNGLVPRGRLDDRF